MRFAFFMLFQWKLHNALNPIAGLCILNTPSDFLQEDDDGQLSSNISSLPHWQRHSMKCVFLYGTHSLYISIYDQREWAQDRNFNVTSSLKLPWICWIKSLSLFGGAVNYWKLHSVYIHYTSSVQMSCTKDSAKKLELKWPVCSECHFALIV